LDKAGANLWMPDEKVDWGSGALEIVPAVTFRAMSAAAGVRATFVAIQAFLGGGHSHEPFVFGLAPNYKTCSSFNASN